MCTDSIAIRCNRTEAVLGNMQCLKERFNQAELESKEYKRLKSESDKLYSSSEIENYRALENCQNIVDNLPPLLEGKFWNIL